MASNTTSNRVIRLDALRALSIVLVVFSHGGSKVIPGGLGVLIFFVISGYVITNSFVKEFDKTKKFSISKFYARRILKIFPPLIIIVLIPSLIMRSLLDIKLQFLLAQSMFFYNWTIIKNGSGGVLPGSEVVWSLSIEEQYYLGVAVCWCIIQIVRKKTALKYLALLYFIIYLYSTLAKFYISYSNEEARDATNNLSRIYFGTDCRISSIVVGGLLAIWLHRDSSFRIVAKYNMELRKNVTFYFSIFLFIFTLVVRESHFRDTLRFSIQEIAAVILCYVSVRMKFPSYIDKLALSKLVQAIGKSSYSTYLVHLTFMLGLGAFFEIDISTSNYILKAIIIVFTFCIGYIAHCILDQPFEKLRNRLH